MSSPLDDLVTAVEKACVVLRTMAEELDAESNAPKARLLRTIARALEYHVRLLSSAPSDETPLPGATYVERLFLTLEDPRGHVRPLVMRWLRRRWHEAIVLVREALKALEVYGGEIEFIEAARRWLERVVDGPGDDVARR